MDQAVYLNFISDLLDDDLLEIVVGIAVDAFIVRVDSRPFWLLIERQGDRLFARMNRAPIKRQDGLRIEP